MAVWEVAEVVVMRGGVTGSNRWRTRESEVVEIRGWQVRGDVG